MCRTIHATLLVGVLAVLLPACKRAGNDETTAANENSASKPAHVHADGTVHDDHGKDQNAEDAHDEISLGAATIGDVQVELAQGHGRLEAGKEGHLVVKLPYNDQGQTILRAWIGSEDRLRSIVGKGAYAPSHDNYDIHAMAPTTLPENVMWWIEIEKPDGTKVTGSAKPLVE